MTRRLWTFLCIFLLAACAQDQTFTDTTPTSIKSGFEFLTPETQALQSDTFANPGMLWVDRGRALFDEMAQRSPSCQSCHSGDQNQIDSAAATYPKIDPQSGTLLNLEGRINYCRVTYQLKDPLAYETDDLLSLTAYVGSLSQGARLSTQLTPENRSHYETGEIYFYTRRGQLNLSCAQCHNENWGRKIRGDTISQGHGNGFPAYRFEWESLGSLHRRLSDCDAGVRAEPHALGSQAYLYLELYLAVRASGLDVETPAVRR